MDEVEDLEYDPVLLVEDQGVFDDPIIVTGADLALIEGMIQKGFYSSRLLGIQIHRCPYAKTDEIVVMDRSRMVDDEGLCLVCGGETV